MIFEGHPSWRSIIDFYLKGIAATAVIALAAALISGAIGDQTNKGLVVLIAIIGVGLTVLVGFVRRVATSYTITNRRLHIKRGIISRTIQETRLERVQNVNYRQNFIQRILQIGDVDFDTAASSDFDFVFGGVAEPADVVHKVDEATRGLAPPTGLGDEQHGHQPPAS